MTALTIGVMYTTLIDCQTLAQQLDNPEWVIVDCRCDLMQPQAGREAYQSGHLPGSVYADLNQDLSGPVTPVSGRHPLPDPQRLAGLLGQWGVSPHSQVVAYDAGNSAFAVRLWWRETLCRVLERMVPGSGQSCYKRSRSLTRHYINQDIRHTIITSHHPGGFGCKPVQHPRSAVMPQKRSSAPCWNHVLRLYPCITS